MKNKLYQLLISSSFFVMALSSPSLGMEVDPYRTSVVSRDTSERDPNPYSYSRTTSGTSSQDPYSLNPAKGRIRVLVAVKENADHTLRELNDFCFGIKVVSPWKPGKEYDSSLNGKGVTLSIDAGTDIIEFYTHRHLSTYFFTDEHPFEHGVDMKFLMSLPLEERVQAAQGMGLLFSYKHDDFTHKNMWPWRNVGECYNLKGNKNFLQAEVPLIDFIKGSPTYGAPLAEVRLFLVNELLSHCSAVYGLYPSTPYNIGNQTKFINEQEEYSLSPAELSSELDLEIKNSTNDGVVVPNPDVLTLPTYVPYEPLKDNNGPYGDNPGKR